MSQTPRSLLVLVFSNAGWKLLSLAVAVILWNVVAAEPELSMFTSVRLEYRNLPDDVEISSDPVKPISLELRGPSGSLRSLAAATAGPEVVLDMSAVQPGDRTFPIADANVKLASDVRLVRAIPSEVRFTFERRRSRWVPVTPRFTGQGQNGYELEKWVVEPASIEVQGPASRLARLASVSTDAVDVSGVVGSSEFRVNAFLGDPYLRFVSGARVAVTVAMRKR
jgi:YbbR domain-containing protein